MSDHGMYHYPNMTDVEAFRSSALECSKTETVILHFHPYKDTGCEDGLKERGDEYNGLPIHEQYSDGKLMMRSKS